MRTYGFTLLLNADPMTIERYREHHRRAWPVVPARLREAGIERMRIFLLGRRLFMYCEAHDGFDPERDFARLGDEPAYRRWDELMRSMQESVPEAAPGEWWARMEQVYDLDWPTAEGAEEQEGGHGPAAAG